MTHRLAAVAVAIASAVAIAGCGLGAGVGTSGVSLTVTRDFGSRPVSTITDAHVPGSETVMRMLERSYRVGTRYGGGFVQTINGLGPSGPSDDWFYYVNGVQAPRGAASTSVHAGDRIWWDLHDYRATQTVPAVVGSFPEPFLHGIGGKRYPVTIQCATDVRAACTRVTSALTALHIPTGPQLIGTGSGTDTLTLVVATWSQISAQVGSELVAYGPGASGIYARFEDHGQTLALLNPAGRVAQTLGAGAGLVAATATSSTVPTWLITGTDVAGVNAAAAALTPQALRNHFALAVDGSRQVPVPVDASQ